MKTDVMSTILKSCFSRLGVSVLLALVLLGWPLGVWADEKQVEAAPLELSISEPSGVPETIAPGHNIYVMGHISGDADAITELQVSLKDSKDIIVRKVSTAVKSNKSLNVNYDKLSFGYNDSPDYRSAFINSGMPDLIVSDLDNPAATMEKASIKCYFDDSSFSALLAGGINPELERIGVTSSGLDLKDEDGKNFACLEEGASYTISVTALDKEQREIATADKIITIGYTADKLLSRFSPNNHMTAAQAFADSIGAAVYLDLFPGYWDSNGYFGEIKSQWQLADAAEYVFGKTHCVLYNITKSSSSYSVELGTLQKLGVIDDKDLFASYYYNIGEPELGSTQGEIIQMAHNDKLALTRVDMEKTENKENEFIPYAYDPSAIKSDTDLSDGVTAKVGDTLSFYGVAAPIQLNDSEIEKSAVDNSYTLNNKINTLSYHITGDGVDQTLNNKEVKLVRYFTESDYENGWGSASEVEFKHNLTIDASMAGKTLNISITGYDVNGQPIEGTEESVTLTVEQTTLPVDESHPVTPDNPKTGDDTDFPLLPLMMIVIILCGSAVLTKKHAS